MAKHPSAHCIPVKPNVRSWDEKRSMMSRNLAPNFRRNLRHTRIDKRGKRMLSREVLGCVLTICTADTEYHVWGHELGTSTSDFRQGGCQMWRELNETGSTTLDHPCYHQRSELTPSLLPRAERAEVPPFGIEYGALSGKYSTCILVVGSSLA